MALMVGALLAFAVGMFARTIGLDRDRAFYPTVMIFIALFYALFAVMGASTSAFVIEFVVGAVFIVAVAVGFKSSLWVIVFVLGAHGVFDLVHSRLISNPGVPTWWPAFCLSYDVTAAAFLAWLLKTGRSKAA